MNNHNTLFDIGRDMDSLSGKEKLFYRHQLTTHKERLSEKLGEEHIIELETQYLQETVQESVDREEVDFINDVGSMDESSDDDYIDPTLDIFVTSNNLNEGLSTNRSGFVRLLTKAADLLKFSIFFAIWDDQIQQDPFCVDVSAASVNSLTNPDLFVLRLLLRLFDVTEIS